MHAFLATVRSSRNPRGTCVFALPVAGVGDFNGDGTSDVLWRKDSDGHVGIREMHNNVAIWHDLGLSSGVDHAIMV